MFTRLRGTWAVSQMYKVSGRGERGEGDAKRSEHRACENFRHVNRILGYADFIVLGRYDAFNTILQLMDMPWLGGSCFGARACTSRGSPELVLTFSSSYTSPTLGRP